MVDVPRQVSPLVGRDAELTELTRFARAAADGVPGAMLIAGDAGVGKSRLIAELADRAAADGMVVLTGHCVNLPDGGPPYLPFVDALRRVDGTARERLDAHLRGGAAGDSMGALQIYEGAVEVLWELAAADPVLLVIEDLHWADRSSQDLLRYLLGRLEGERIGIVLSVRSDDLHRRHPVRGFLAELARHPRVGRVSLDPLTAEAIKHLITATECGAALDSRALADIVSRADGNAFFAEELLEAARSSGNSRGLPEALLDVLTSRLEQLDGNAAAVIGVAAVAGRRVPHEVLAEVTGLPQDELDAALREAVGGHVLVGDPDQPSYQFRHALMQEAAYADLLPGERVRLHAAYAKALRVRLDDRPALAAELAHHAEASHDLPLALASSVRAADHALSVYAPSQARIHLERALQWWDQVPDAESLAGAGEAELYLRAAAAAQSAGEAPRTVALLQGAVDRLAAPDAPPDQAAVALARLSNARFTMGDLDQTLESSTRAVEMVADIPRSAATAEVHAQQALLLFTLEKPGAEEHARIALADAIALGAPAIEAGALVTLARIAEMEGDADTAQSHLTRALHLAEQINDVGAELRVMFNLAMSRYDAGDLPGTLQWTSRSNVRAMATGTAYSEYAKETVGIDVIARYVSGDWDTGLRRMAVRVDRSPAWDRPLLEAFGLHVAVGRGMDDVADRLARLESSRHPDPWADAQIVMLAEGCRIDHLTWQRDYPGAADALRRGVEHPAETWGPHFLGRIWLDALGLAALADQADGARLHGDDAAAGGAVAEGRLLVENAREVAELGQPRGARLGAEGVAWLARAEAEWIRLQDVGGAEAEQAWVAAVAAFDYGYVYEVARCRWRLAETLIRNGNDAGAAEQLALAHQAAVTLGARPLRDAIIALARRARIAGIGEGSDERLNAGVSGEGQPSPLTPREQEVLRLLAEGHTNRQIGKALFISEKTASVHVSNILAKLGAGNRGEAVSLARKRQLI